MDPSKLHMMKVDEALLGYTVGTDYLLDRELVEADCFGSAGHAAGLAKIGVLSEVDRQSLVEGLREIVELSRKGEFEIGREQEDCHTAIETHLSAARGEVGRRIHAGRSRNDQVVAALRLYGKWEMLRLARSLDRLAHAALEFARKHRDVPMVGRTHMQRAMPSSVGIWMGALAEMLADDMQQLWAAYNLNDQCPLGSAASYGVPLALDREYVSDLLGFSRLQNNVLYVANSRGKVEGAVLGVCSGIMVDLSRYAQDLMLFTMPEFGYFSLPEEMCTGSSLMPQKRNPCAMELVRARTSTVIAEHARVMSILKALPTGYNRDGQETKKPFMNGLAVTLSSVEIMTRTIEKLEVNEEKLLAGFQPEVFATDHALELVAEGKPFRDAYRETKESLGKLHDRNPHEAIAKKTHAGAPANPRFEVAEAALGGHSARTDREVREAREAFGKLMGIDGPSSLSGL